MLKHGEKIIFSIKSGFSLNGIGDYDLEDKCLHFTNLGNIYISKVDCLEEECTDFIMYDYTAHKATLYSEIDGENINVISERLPITIYRNGRYKNTEASILMILDFEEFNLIENSLKEMIFDFKPCNTLIILDGRYTYSGSLWGNNEKITFNTTNNQCFEFKFTDVEYFNEEYNRITLFGYFYIDSNSSIVRKISIVGNISQYKLPIGFELIVEKNKKIGFVPWNDKMVVGNISGKVNSKIYKNEDIYIIKHENVFIFYEKNTKKEIFSRCYEKFSKYDIGDSKYIVYDGVNVYTMKINRKNYEKIGFGKIKTITDKYIGYTVKKNPFFVKADGEFLKICSSKEKSILEIKKSTISNITINEELSLENGDLVNTEIKFGSKKVYLNLKRSLITEITENVFSDYQKSLFENASKREVYENWVKTVSDMVIYNIFGEIYRINGKFLKPDISKYNLLDWIFFVNKYYLKLEKIKKETDKITVYLPNILQKNEDIFFKGMGKEVNLSPIEKLEKEFLEVRYALNRGFNEVLDKFNMISSVVMPEELIDEYIDSLNEHEIYQIEYFAKQGMENLCHLLYDMLPHYIEKIIKAVFNSYLIMYYEYEKLEERELKIELMNRIKSAHIFKQFTVSSGSSILRKEVVEDLYSLVKFSSMKIDSEFYYTGGYR